MAEHSPRSCRRTFEADPRSVAEARRFARCRLAGSPADAVEAVELMVSELVTNSIRHARSAFSLSIEARAGEVRVEVSDGSSAAPQMRYPEPTDEHGRGLRIIDLLADAWGVERRRTRGKTVWFVLAS